MNIRSVPLQLVRTCAVETLFKLENIYPAYLQVDVDDLMFRHFMLKNHSYIELASFFYFRSGISLFKTVRRVWELWGIKSPKEVLFLDFGAGSGRGTRFFINYFTPENVYVSEVLESALVFHRAISKVNTFPSCFEPERLKFPRKFDLILASSVFTHLTARHFPKFLNKLFDALSPGGLLLVSVHGKDTLLPGREMDEEGIYCERIPDEEFIDPLPEDCYVTTWVTEQYMEKLLRGLQAYYLYFPKLLWGIQDLYVIAKRELNPMMLTYEPIGFVDKVTYTLDTLIVEGWSATLDKSTPTIELFVEGSFLADTTPFIERADVQAVYKSYKIGSKTGFRLEIPISYDIKPSSSVLIYSRSNAEKLALLGGSLEGLGRFSYAKQLEVENEKLKRRIGVKRAQLGAMWWRARERKLKIEHLEARIAAMESSFFWRLRNAWWRFREFLGIGKVDNLP